MNGALLWRYYWSSGPNKSIVRLDGRSDVGGIFHRGWSLPKMHGSAWSYLVGGISNSRHFGRRMRGELIR